MDVIAKTAQAEAVTLATTNAASRTIQKQSIPARIVIRQASGTRAIWVARNKEPSKESPGTAASHQTPVAC